MGRRVVRGRPAGGDAAAREAQPQAPSRASRRVARAGPLHSGPFVKRTSLITLLLASLLGIAIGWLTLPAWRVHRALAAIADPDPARRQAGWERLLITDGEIDCARAEALLPKINRRLSGAGDEALLDAGAALRACDLWNWTSQKPDLLLRDLPFRASSADETEQIIAAELMQTCPRDLDPRSLMAIFDSLLNSDSPDVRHVAFSAACGWTGRADAHRLEALDIPRTDHRLDRLRQLALTWARPVTPPKMIDPDAPAEIVEALLLRWTIARRDDASAVLDVLESWSGEPRPAFEYILRYSDDERAAQALRGLADEGSAIARYVLDAKADGADETLVRRLAENPAQAPATRRLAAWRCEAVPLDAVRAILALDPAESDGSVYAAALLAERRLPRDEARSLAESWIRSFNDDEKRAGALLAALLGEHLPLLQRACEIEDVPIVRTTQRLALWAAGQAIGEEDPVEFAHRALHRTDGEFHADTALCMLLVGRQEAIALLTSRPTGDEAPAARQRAWLIERFIPAWHEAVGWPIGGDGRAVRLHFDRLEALRLLTRRCLRFDAQRKIYADTSSGEMSTPSVDSGPPG